MSTDKEHRTKAAPTGKRLQGGGGDGYSRRRFAPRIKRDTPFIGGGLNFGYAIDGGRSRC